MLVRGSVFEFVRNDLFDAGNFFDVKGTKSELRRNQFGATIGGPIYIPHIYNGHDKTFFLLSEESYRQVARRSNSLGIVPTFGWSVAPETFRSPTTPYGVSRIQHSAGRCLGDLVDDGALLNFRIYNPATNQVLSELPATKHPASIPSRCRC